MNPHPSPFVILHGVLTVEPADAKQKPKPLYLGQCGWSAQLGQALRFNTGGEAEQWIAEASKSTPALFAGAKAKVAQLQRPALIETAGHAVLADYDPFANERRA